MYMDEITFRTDILTKLKKECASDDDVIEAMLVCSDKNIPDMTDSAKFGRINALMRERHGTPFEHNFLKFYSEAPIFVYREWHRHRIGVSINEQSGRYSELPPMFYIPPRERPLVKVEGTKQMDYISEDGGDELYEWLIEDLKEDCTDSYNRYLRRLERGVVKEVARIGLNLNIFSKMVWSCNARSLMAFLSLRTRREAMWVLDPNDPAKKYLENEEGAMFPSKPQWEIEVAANTLEEVFAAAMPMTHQAFIDNGRVCP